MPDPIDGYSADEVEEIKRGILALGAAQAALPTAAEGMPRLTEVAGFGLAPERVEVTYSRYVSPEEALIDSLSDEQKQSVHSAAQQAAAFGGCTVDQALSALISVMANYKDADA